MLTSITTVFQQQISGTNEIINVKMMANILFKNHDGKGVLECQIISGCSTDRYFCYPSDFK